MARPPFSLRILRSRRLAVGLLVAVAAVSVVGTVVPQLSGVGEPGVSAWRAAHPVAGPLASALGLNSVFSSPVFVALAALLAACTAACAWERTALSLRLLRAAGSVSGGEAARLSGDGALAVPLGGATGQGALDRTEAAFRRRGMRVHRGPKLLEATRARSGLLASPLMHWTLTLLFAVIVAGRLTRAEGTLAVPVGGSVVDRASAYAMLHDGPLYPGHSGLTLSASDLVLRYRDREGVERDASPLVTLSRGGAVLASGHVYPNGPLRLGSLLVHMAGYGLAPEVALETSAGSLVATGTSFVGFAPTRSGTTEGRFDFSDASGGSRPGAIVTVPADRSAAGVLERMPAVPRLQVSLLDSRGKPGTPRTLRVGEAVDLGGGYRLRFVALRYYVRLSVADDPSVYPLYALFVFAATVMSVSLFLPYRRVLVRLTAEGEPRELRTLVTHGADDPAFMERTRQALLAAVEPVPAEEETA